mmetsp:Transcript_1982/g.2069  ORF Transcript_1982/g.2069 Transcript_1982/m.2069 type:complete len:199 (-) Transcript_1982:314-910(-)
MGCNASTILHSTEHLIGQQIEKIHEIAVQYTNNSAAINERSLVKEISYLIDMSKTKTQLKAGLFSDLILVLDYIDENFPEQSRLLKLIIHDVKDIMRIRCYGLSNSLPPLLEPESYYHPVSHYTPKKNIETATDTSLSPYCSPRCSVQYNMYDDLPNNDQIHSNSLKTNKVSFVSCEGSIQSDLTDDMSSSPKGLQSI